MNTAIKLILATAALIGFASCASNDPAPMPAPPMEPVDDGSVYSDK